MPVPSSIADLSQTPGLNSPAGSESPALIDDYLRTLAAFVAQLRDGSGFSAPVDLPSAATVDIGAQASLSLRITGTVTITSFGANYGAPRFLVFGGVLTLTHHATSLILPGAANIVTAAGDCAIAIPNQASPNGWRVISYLRAALGPGKATEAASVTGTVAIANGGTGQTSAATAFNAIKQAASTSETGVVQYGSDADAQAASAANRAITPSNLAAVLLGIGQTRVNVLASRSLGVNFTNNTGRLIEVTVTAIVPSATTFTLELGGTTVTQSAATAEQRTHFFTVRPGETYRLGGAVTLVSWYELR